MKEVYFYKFINRLLKLLIIIVQSTHTASATTLTDGIANIADAVHTNAHMATTSAHANAFEELATRNAPMDITWIIQVAIADVDRLHIVAKAVVIMDILIATATTASIPAITTTRQRVVTGAANTDIGLQYINPAGMD